PTLQHPTPTLFPYTTLFRSLVRPRHKVSADSARNGGVFYHKLRTLNVRNPARALRTAQRAAPPALGRGVTRRVRRIRGRPIADSDRKSTRLNSSHSQISYAV